MRLRPYSAALLVVALAATGCAEKKKAAPGASVSPSTSVTTPPVENAVEVTGVDYGYTVTGAAKSGLTKITFKNTGQDLHMIALTRLKTGKTAQDALTALKSDPPTDDEAVFEDLDADVDGAPNIISPGAHTTTYATLTSGTYAMICFVTARTDKQPHFLKGMVSELVVDTAPSTAPPPTADGEIKVEKKKLTPPDLSSGKGTYHYVNADDTSHALLIVKLKDGKTFEQFVAWVDKYFVDEGKLEDAPGDFWGGIEATNKEAYLTLDLPPGKYVAFDTESATEEDDTEFYRDDQGGLRFEFTVA